MLEEQKETGKNRMNAFVKRLWFQKKRKLLKSRQENYASNRSSVEDAS